MIGLWVSGGTFRVQFLRGPQLPLIFSTPPPRPHQPSWRLRLGAPSLCMGAAPALGPLEDDEWDDGGGRAEGVAQNADEKRGEGLGQRGRLG